jgi:ABC-2 type transport system permease protein
MAGLALILSFPLWITIAWLGPVDHGATLATYFGSFLAAGAYLAIGTALSAACNTQVVAFVLSTLLAFVLTSAGLPIVGETLAGMLGSGPLGTSASQWTSLISVLDHFEGLQRGVIEAPALIYFVSFIATWLAVATLLVDGKRVVR